MVVSHHGRFAERWAAPGSAGERTVGEMAEGFWCFCSVHINEGIVGVSELMCVTRGAPERILETKTLRTKFTL